MILIREVSSKSLNPRYQLTLWLGCCGIKHNCLSESQKLLSWFFELLRGEQISSFISDSSSPSSVRWNHGVTSWVRLHHHHNDLKSIRWTVNEMITVFKNPKHQWVEAFLNLLHHWLPDLAFSPHCSVWLACGLTPLIEAEAPSLVACFHSNHWEVRVRWSTGAIS